MTFCLDDDYTEKLNAKLDLLGTKIEALKARAEAAERDRDALRAALQQVVAWRQVRLHTPDAEFNYLYALAYPKKKAKP